MPSERRPSSNSGRPPRAGRPSGSSGGGSRNSGAGQKGRGSATGGSSARGSSGRGSSAPGPRRDDSRPGRAATPRRYDTDGGRSGPSRRDAPRRDPRATPTEDGESPRRYNSSRPTGRGRVAPRRVERPKTAAQTRAAIVKAERGVREPREKAAPPPWEREQWIDDGPLRSAARKAASRAQKHDAGDAPSTGRRGKSLELAPEVAEDLQRAAPAARAAKYQERLATAADALDRGRYDDARRMVQPVLRDLPDLAFGHEIAGLAFYRTEQWRKAAAELEVARELDRSLDHHPVLADCYRALKRYDMVDKLWRQLRDGSPAPALMAEGRIVAAGALADQGDLKGALKLMERGADVPKKIREHHLRQWYVIGDLHDRSGDIIKARRFFGMIAEVDPNFADVSDRLRALGR
jgi:tetratricopeptide (TPR) repeat protein